MEDQLLLMTMVQAGLSHCTVVIEQNGHILMSLFMAGLLGSATHCIGMCGPFVLSQVTARLETIPLKEMSEFKRLTGAALVPYHLGRLTTYIFLGAAVALLAKGALSFGGMKWLSAALLLIAAFMFLGYALKRLGIILPRLNPFKGTGTPPLVQRFSGMLSPLFARPLGWRGYGLGIGLGFLPCGLLYGALAAAGASGDPLAGAFSMIAFGLGTIPSLLVIAFAGHMAGQKWRQAMVDLAPLLLIINAGVLSYLAWTLVV